MAIDTAYEVDFGGKYIEQKLFDELLGECGVDNLDGEYIESRLTSMMDKLMEELGKNQ
ncbi:hypothetical protein [Oceanobacillus sp. FSL H7-0719]|uniref:hypothetical protein n=1 Tax=Oceanobacillus sp. FSL H7-0719 TaxID=2954507 RepID=UPI003251034D